jgi:hypothetical protein
MPKGKQKNHKPELEYFRSKLKEKEKLVKSLQQRIKYLENHQYSQDEIEDKNDQYIEVSKKEEKSEDFSCPIPMCTGVISNIRVGIGQILVCSICDYRKLVRNEQKTEG